ncbi:MAG TPA: hypothetical protein VG603_03475 [Chitinophagales bacterium]|nr:hypothetical protein [Chitinophagales bacterium]
MKYFPNEEFDINTSLSVSQTIDLLQQNIQPGRSRTLHLFEKPEKPYIGEWSGQSFTISRILNYRNSFNPVITGTVRETPLGSSIHVKMQLHSFVKSFMLLWFTPLLLALLFLIYDQISHWMFSPGTLFILAFLAFGYGILMIGFKIESSRSYNFLENLFKE